MSADRCNVLLISPRFPELSFWNSRATCEAVGARYPVAPLGLLTVAAMLPPQWNCRLIDRNVSRLVDADIAWADLIMIGAMITQRADCLDLIDRIQARGKVVAVGGPDVTGSPHAYDRADFIVAGEAEDVIKEFIAAWQSGARSGIFTAEKFKADVTSTPIPRFDLVRRSDYVYFGVQFSRGCPFTCEFCDIIELFGRTPRVKTADQMLRELEAVYRSGYRGHLDFVDDNFIGNKKAVKAFLPHLIAWQKEHDYPFDFSTEASVNLADDDALLAMMREANFFLVFVGIESPDTDTLVAMRKKQNTRRSIAASINKIHETGFIVIAGFIVGFDTEDGHIADAMIDCIEDAAIPMCMVGLLYALPNTQLSRRLTSEKRIFPEDWALQKLSNGVGIDQCTAGLNFTTLRPRRDILADHKSVIDRAYAPEAYFARVMRMAGTLNRYWPERKADGGRWSLGGIPLHELPNLFRIAVFMAWRQPWIMKYFARSFYTCLRDKPGALHAVVFHAALYMHLGPFAKKASASIAEQIARIDSGEWSPPLMADMGPAEPRQVLPQTSPVSFDSNEAAVSRV